MKRDEPFDSSETGSGGQRGSMSPDEAAALLLLLGLLLPVVFLDWPPVFPCIFLPNHI